MNEEKKCECAKVLEKNWHFPECDGHAPAPHNHLQGWDEIAARTALKAHKEKAHYARFSETIYKGIEEALQAQRTSIAANVEGMKREWSPMPHNELRAQGYNAAINDLLSAIREEV